MSYSLAALRRLREQQAAAAEAPPAEWAPPIPRDAACVTAACGETRIWLVRDGERWLMFAGSRRRGTRRRDFASPFLRHAMRTAEAWYGEAADGWRAEEGSAQIAKEIADADPGL
ncbi:MAG: hypothetical protein KIT09_28070 [Bryobacteraceae bacterium]|nr:hypothetical protein [Bryobacteraceae bacterium]